MLGAKVGKESRRNHESWALVDFFGFVFFPPKDSGCQMRQWPMVALQQVDGGWSLHLRRSWEEVFVRLPNWNRLKRNILAVIVVSDGWNF